MGRMLEAFKRVDPQRPQPAETASTPHLAWPKPEPVPQPTADVEEDVPFIEVGGPRETMEASPDVLAAGANSAPKSSAGPRLRPIASHSVGGMRARSMSVAFRPLADDPEPRSPAHRRFAPELIAFHRSEHPASEQYRVLVGGIAAQLPAGRSQVVLFTALTPEAGTTTVLLNTAITLARQGDLRVVVVDANWHRPAIAKRLELPDCPGLREFLDGKASLTQALQETGQPHLLALTAGAGNRDVGDAIRPVLRQLRERFDLVFVDGPCWDGRPEMVALSAACDVAYLVLPEAEADTAETEAWVRTLPRQGARLRGCIVTQR
jgi:Mrp family chromosome partitioning ATPase